MVGMALFAGLRRGEPFGLRWRDVEEQNQSLTGEAVYEGAFSTPKTTAGIRQILLSAAAMQLILDWRARVAETIVGTDRSQPSARRSSSWSPESESPAGRSADRPILGLCFAKSPESRC